MQALLYADIGRNTFAESLGGSQYAFPKFVQGDHVRCGLRWTRRFGSESIEVQRTVHALRVTLGRDDARPLAGAGRFKVGDEGGVIGSNVTGVIPWNAGVMEVESAFNKLTALTAEEKPVNVRSVNGSWLLTFKNGVAKTIALYENSFFPVSFLRSRVQVVDGKTVHDLRLTQSPVAFTTAFAAVVPVAPSITALRSGGSEGINEWNEVQRLVVPPDFRGTYQISRGFKKSPLLDIADDVEEIAEALKAIADVDGEFIVTNPTGNAAHIEFAGSMAGTDQDLLTVTVYDAPPGDPTFTLSLDTAELAVLLNDHKSEKLPLEIEVELEDEQDSEIITRHTFRSEVEVLRELGWEGLAEAQNIDWMRPPLPKDYIPFTVDQVNSGILHHSETLGNGVLTEFVVDHNLGSESVLVLLRQNSTPGAVLRQGVDYALAIEDGDSISIELLGDYLADPPEAGALAVTVLAMGQASQFNAHTHTKAQVVGLQADLDAFSAAIAELQAAVGVGVAPATIVSGVTGPSAEWNLRRIALVYPVRDSKGGLVSIEGLDKAETVGDIPLDKLPRVGGLLPAVHDAAAEDLPDPLPDEVESEDAGRVYENTGGEAVDLPGSYGRKTVRLLPGQFAALLFNEDTGRESWYRVARIDDAKSSWYPVDFDRELFVLPINEKQLRVGKKLTVQFGFETAILNSNTLAQWVLRIEYGTASEKAAPGTPDKNVDDIAWEVDSPILEHRFHLTPDATVHRAGCVITRTAADEISATALIYDATQGGGDIPSANFFLRARLVQFDTQDGEPDPRGFVALMGLARAIGESSDSALGKAIITSA